MPLPIIGPPPRIIGPPPPIIGPRPPPPPLTCAPPPPALWPPPPWPPPPPRPPPPPPLRANTGDPAVSTTAAATAQLKITLRMVNSLCFLWVHSSNKKSKRRFR